MRLIKLFILLLMSSSCFSYGNDLDLLRNSYMLLSEMHKRMGLQNQTTVIIDSEVKIAMSKFEKDQSFIHINPVFYTDSNIQNNNTVLAGLIAHELGHILADHNHNNHTHIEEELAADYFAGFILKRLGYDIKESLATLTYFQSIIDTTTHGNIADRFMSIQKGHHAATCNHAMDRSLFTSNAKYAFKIHFEKLHKIYFIDENEVFTIDFKNNKKSLGTINKKSGEIILDKQRFLVDLQSLKIWMITSYDVYIEAGNITPRERPKNDD